MDEQKLAELFRDAARDAPPPSFDVSAVRSASARATSRRRSAIAAGSVLGLALVFGGVVVTTDFARDMGSHATAGSAQDSESLNVAPFDTDDPEALPQEVSPDSTGGTLPKNIPEDSSTQGDEPSGSADRSTVGSAQRGCVEVDRELAVALADELSVANAGASPPDADCPEGTRGARLPVRDGAVTGTVSAVIAPVGTAGLVHDRSYAYASAKTSDGAELYVISRSDDGSSPDPFARDLPSIAARLAARF